MEIIPKEAIENAIEGGWEPFKTVKAKDILLNVNGRKIVDGKTMATRYLAEVALDPAFWQALGKALGWLNKLNPEWRTNARKFYDLILTNGDLATFWADLLGPKSPTL